MRARSPAPPRRPRRQESIPKAWRGHPKSDRACDLSWGYSCGLMFYRVRISPFPERKSITQSGHTRRLPPKISRANDISVSSELGMHSQVDTLQNVRYTGSAWSVRQDTYPVLPLSPRNPRRNAYAILRAPYIASCELDPVVCTRRSTCTDGQQTLETARTQLHSHMVSINTRQPYDRYKLEPRDVPPIL